MTTHPTPLRILFTLALCCLLTEPAFAQGLPRARPEDVGLSATALERITTTLQSYVDSGTFPGFLALIARHGKVAYVASVGWMDVEHQRAMSPDAVFRIYSLTKPIASAAAMQLYERGKLRLEDPVSKYVPAFAGVKVYAGGGAATPVLRDPERPITLADLLTHASGLTYGFIGNTPADSIYRRANLYNPRWTLAQLSDSLAHLPLAFSPGTRWNYSYSIDVLARVVELVSGMTFDRYLDSMLFRPLGMSMTAFHVTPAMEGHLTTAYALGPDGKLHATTPLIATEYAPEGRMLSGGGGLLSTLSDYLRFAQMLLNGGELDGHRVLKRETVALMMRDHLPPGLTPIPPITPDWPPGKNGFGYGGAVRVDSDTTPPGSPGTFRWAGAASTFFWVDPQADLVAMVWTQHLPPAWSLDAQFQRLVYASVKGR
jgi:CubicO group peptidase (beta-lactamase class C family)